MRLSAALPFLSGGIRLTTYLSTVAIHLPFFSGLWLKFRHGYLGTFTYRSP